MCSSLQNVFPYKWSRCRSRDGVFVLSGLPDQGAQGSSLATDIRTGTPCAFFHLCVGK